MEEDEFNDDFAPISIEFFLHCTAEQIIATAMITTIFGTWKLQAAIQSARPASDFGRSLHCMSFGEIQTKLAQIPGCPQKQNALEIPKSN